MSAQKTGIKTMRKLDRTLGSVRIADDPGAESPVPFIGRAGGIRTRDLLTPSQTR